ncbi:unnamed protein product [Debaryomyces tyrocola]|nr:unnamed protein product [Debaryomyces tyrocola]
MVCRKIISPNFSNVLNDLSIIDKLLPLLIISAMVLGILLSVYVPSSRDAFDGAKVIGVSVPLAIGLMIMMIPPLCGVRWEIFLSFHEMKNYVRPISISLIVNWIVCPFLMLGLAWLSLFDKDEYRTGIIMIGLARCIAMVLIWNKIADGDNSLGAVIVLVNSLLRIVLYAPYQIFFCYVISGDYHSSAVTAGISYPLVAQSVAFFLGIPLGIGFLIRSVASYTIGIEAYESKIYPFIEPWALIGLLYTIIVIFIKKGNDFIHDIGSAIRCLVPSILYFIITWFGTFFVLRWYLGRGRPVNEDGNALFDEQLLNASGKWVSNGSARYSEVITQAFTASSNNFELSIAIAISLYGTDSKEVIATTFGPLLEVPILLFLCFVAKYFKIKFLWVDVDSGNTEEVQLENCNNKDISIATSIQNI